MKLLTLALVLSGSFAQAATWDNEAGKYTLPPLPFAAAEAQRLDTDQREDQQPLGRTVQAGDLLTLILPTLPGGVSADLTIGFREMWGPGPGQQVEPLARGQNTITASQSGPVFVRLNGIGADVTFSLTGGQVIPLYVDAAMSAADWQAELAAHKGAEYVQLVGDRALITLPAHSYDAAPIPDPAASFAMINKVLQLEDDLSGLDGSTALDTPTPLRLHFLVDFRATAADRENFYMYATDGFIGMLPDNTGDLTNPDSLSQLWGIWHEVGHIHQQHSWTWGSATEITVNIWSLFVQQALGQPSRLAQPENGGKSTLALARDYIGAGDGVPDFIADNYDTVFIRLVMFDQLARVYGWDLYRNLNKAARRNPLAPDRSDQDRVDYFVTEICTLTGHDLRGFFRRWGLMASDAALADIEAMRLPLPPTDPARVF